VIGGTLFIGRALVEQLLERADDVVIMHRGTGTPFGTRVSEIQCDRNDVASVRAALTDRRFDVVYDNVYDWQRGTTADQGERRRVGRVVRSAPVCVHLQHRCLSVRRPV
jgi:nucleoside-diphosphate-sugar epimerase